MFGEVVLITMLPCKAARILNHWILIIIFSLTF